MESAGTWFWVTEGSKAACDRFRASNLVPDGFVVDNVVMDGITALITVRSAAKASACPGCGIRSERIHSRCGRRLADLPIARRPDPLMVWVRRFYGNAVLYGGRVFAERLEVTCLPHGCAGRRGSTTSSIISASPWAAGLPPALRASPFSAAATL
ncbi:MAG: hypothetical protein M0Z28_18350 [Rhodospirillales bacterium]|nr:hypothetical protein [Rhodospirillales bacterium]